jgi:hypothetical protein
MPDVRCVKCKGCFWWYADRSKEYADRFADLSKFYADESKRFADACQCNKELK